MSIKSILQSSALIAGMVLVLAGCREDREEPRASQPTGESWAERTMTENDAAQTALEDNPMQLDDPANLESPLWRNDPGAAPDPIGME